MRDLSRSDTALLKGLAIFAIIVHNYAHWLPACVPENEYRFDVANTWKLVDYLSHVAPHIVFNLFSYFGHYGVPVFLFVSGYGLVKKYERSAVAVRTLLFMRYEAVKLWQLLIPAMILFLLTDPFLHGGRFVHTWESFAYMFMFVSNFLVIRDLLLGPWWYFSLILQCYLLYAGVFRRFRTKGVLLGAVLICFIVQVYFGDFAPGLSFDWFNYLRYQFVGSLLPFAAGIWVARYGNFFLSGAMPLSLVLLLAGCFHLYLWLLTPLFVLGVIVPLASLLRGWIRKPLERLGQLSAALFVTHALIRPFFVGWVRIEPSMIYVATAAYIVCALLLAWGYQGFVTGLSSLSFVRTKKRRYINLR